MELEEEFGPQYNVDSATLKKFRRGASKGLSKLSREERQAYGAAVEAAVLASQRAALLRGAVALPRIYGKNEDIGANIRRQHHNALLACAAKERRERTPEKWREMYDAAMAEKRKPKPEPMTIVRSSSRRDRAEALLRAARERLAAA